MTEVGGLWRTLKLGRLCNAHYKFKPLSESNPFCTSWGCSIHGINFVAIMGLFSHSHVHLPLFQFTRHSPAPLTLLLPEVCCCCCPQDLLEQKWPKITKSHASIPGKHFGRLWWWQRVVPGDKREGRRFHLASSNVLILRGVSSSYLIWPCWSLGSWEEEARSLDKDWEVPPLPNLDESDPPLDIAFIIFGWPHVWKNL